MFIYLSMDLSCYFCLSFLAVLKIQLLKSMNDNLRFLICLFRYCNFSYTNVLIILSTQVLLQEIKYDFFLQTTLHVTLDPFF